MTASVWLSIIAIAISLSTWVIEVRRRCDEVREGNSASIQAHLLPHSGGLSVLEINNSGQAPARIKSVDLDGQDIYEGNRIHDPKCQHEIIGPKSRVHFKIKTSFDHSPPGHVLILWDDDYQSDRSYENSLSA